ncbi:hypothetical protein BDC45DRAFT_514856, partial [Circinella umbellata]
MCLCSYSFLCPFQGLFLYMYIYKYIYIYIYLLGTCVLDRYIFIMCVYDLFFFFFFLVWMKVYMKIIKN